MKHIKQFEDVNAFKDEDLLKIQVEKLKKFFKESGILTEVTDSFDYAVEYDDNNRYFFVTIDDDSEGRMDKGSIFKAHADLSKLIDMLDYMRSFIVVINKIVKKIKLEGYDDVTTTVTRTGVQIRIGISKNPNDEYVVFNNPR